MATLVLGNCPSLTPRLRCLLKTITVPSFINVPLINYYDFGWLLCYTNLWFQRSPLVRYIPFKLCLLNLLLRLSLLLHFGTSHWCVYSSNLIASYSVSVRQYRLRSLAYFHLNLTVSNLATCFASERYLRAFGTCTLWDILFKELYLPFKAHIYAMNKWGFICKETFMGIGKSATSFKFKSRRGYEQAERLVPFNPHSS